MPHANTITGSALSLTQPQRSSGTRSARSSTATQSTDPNSLAAVNEDCYGLLLPGMASIGPATFMYLASFYIIPISAVNWPMILPEKILLVPVLLVILTFTTFVQYQISVSLGCFASAMGFLFVALYMPMPTYALVGYFISIAMSLVASMCASEFGEQPRKQP